MAQLLPNLSLRGIGNWLLDVLGVPGLAIGASARAAIADLDLVEQDAWRARPVKRLSPSDLAAAVVKGITPLGSAEDNAVAAGYNADSFATMVAIAGNPPGPEDLMTMWRLGRIDEATLDHGIKEGYLKDEWLSYYHSKRYLPLSLSEYVQAAVQGYVSQAELVALGGQLGFTEADTTIAYETAGNPPGPMETLTMWVRGLLTESQVDQALSESRLKDKYIPAFKQLARHRIPMRTITTLLTHGAITPADAQRMLAELGFTPADANALIASAAKSKTNTHKELSVSTIKSLYTDRLITKPMAVADLQAAGYDAASAAELLDLADAGAVQKLYAAAISKVRSLYVGHKMTDAKLHEELATLNVPADQVGYMTKLWGLEREANVKLLTEAQFRLAVGGGFKTADEYEQFLVAEGYSPADAHTLRQAHGLA